MGKSKGTIVVDVAAAKVRVAKIVPILKKAYPDARVALDHENPLQLLVATIMAAQCTDARVNIVTKDMFKKYKSAADYANVELSELENDIRSTGFYRNKSKNIKAAGALLVEKFGGEVPRTMDELLEIPGVGRKTANVMLGNCFDTPGIVCDTHVIRLSRRLGLSAYKDPTKLEFDLMEIVPRKRGGGWAMFSHLIVFHGRYTCKARKPDCESCKITKYCPSANRPDLW